MAPAFTPGPKGSAVRSDDTDRARPTPAERPDHRDPGAVHVHDGGHDPVAADHRVRPPDLASIRPLPPEDLRERLGRWWSTVGSSRPRAGGRMVAWGCLVVVAGAATWWLVRPPAPPVETVLPMAGAPVSAGSTDAAPAGSGGGAPGGGAPGGEEGGGPGGAGAEVGAAPGSGAATGEGPGSGQDPAAAGATPELVVQAAGAVRVPGVYRLAGGSRVDDLVRAAGGLIAEADVDRVNLAAPLGDGERVWVPRRGEVEVPSVVAGGGGGAAAPAGEPGGDPTSGPVVVDLNTATAEELDTLPGVGPATAAAILAHRDEHGRFTSVDELLDVRGIGEAKLEQIRPLVRV